MRGRPASVSDVNRWHALAVLAVGVLLLCIDVLRAPKKPAHNDDAPAGAPVVDGVDDNGMHDDEDGCGHDHDDGAVDDDDVQGAGDDDDPAQD